MSGGYIAAAVLAVIGLCFLVYLFFIRESHSEDYEAYGYFILGACSLVLSLAVAGATWLWGWL